MKWILLISMILSGCFSGKVGGTVHHEGNVDGTVEVVVRIDVSACMDFERSEDKLECIRALVETFRELNKTAQTVACYKAHPEDPEKCVTGTDNEKIITALTNNSDFD